MQSELTSDQGALHEYTKTVQAKAIQEFIQEQTDGTAVALPEGVQVADLEEYLQHRRRYRGTMSTKLIAEFVEFVNTTVPEYQGTMVDHFPCFVSPDRMSATAFFNLGDYEEPGHGDHRAVLQLAKTESFKALLNADGTRFEQRELAEWMEDWRDHLEALAEDGAILPLSNAVAAIRRITIGTTAETTSEEQTFSNRRSAMAEVEAKHKDTLPAFLKFTCEPYQGLKERTFTVRLSLITGEKPRISARIVRLETAEEEMAKELEDQLRTGFEDTEVRTFVGDFSLRT